MAIWQEQPDKRQHWCGSQGICARKSAPNGGLHDDVNTLLSFRATREICFYLHRDEADFSPGEAGFEMTILYCGDDLSGDVEVHKSIKHKHW